MNKDTLSEQHSLFKKYQALQNTLAPLLENGLLIAFSGGVDSSFLLWSAVKTLEDMKTQNKKGELLALLTVSPSIPAWEIEEAKQFAKLLNVELIIVDSQELKNENYIINDAKRCYFCKSELFNIASKQAKNRGYLNIAYGYNASDRKDVRFGHIAAKENNIYSPLNEVNLEKNEIRIILKEVGLTIADKPSSPCLASRIMTSVPVTEEKLRHIQNMELILRNAGLNIYRARLHEEKLQENNIVKYFRIEIDPDEMPNLLKIRKALVEQAKKMGYKWVNLDLSGYQLGGGTLT